MNFNQYDFFFAYCPSSSETYDDLLPAGNYLRAYCIGKWERLPEIYQRILIYAKKHQISLSGYAYEEGLNEMALKTQHDYVTMITIPCNV